MKKDGTVCKKGDKSVVGTGFKIALFDGGKEVDSVMIVVPGDIDSDGFASATDARLCLRASVGLETYLDNTPEAKACDVNKLDGITADDARLILRYSVGLETSLPLFN